MGLLAVGVGEPTCGQLPGRILQPPERQIQIVFLVDYQIAALDVAANVTAPQNLRAIGTELDDVAVSPHVLLAGDLHVFRPGQWLRLEYVRRHRHSHAADPRRVDAAVAVHFDRIRPVVPRAPHQRGPKEFSLGRPFGNGHIGLTVERSVIGALCGWTFRVPCGPGKVDVALGINDHSPAVHFLAEERGEREVIGPVSREKPARTRSGKRGLGSRGFARPGFVQLRHP